MEERCNMALLRMSAVLPLGFLMIFILVSCQNTGLTNSPIPTPIVIPVTDYSVTFEGMSVDGGLDRSALLTELPTLKLQITPADSGHDNGVGNLGRDNDLSIQTATVVLGLVLTDGREIYQTYKGANISSADYGANPQPGTPRAFLFDWKQLGSNLLLFSTWANGMTSLRVHSVVYYHSSPLTSWTKVTEIPVHQDLPETEGFGYSLSWHINLDTAPGNLTSKSRAWVSVSELFPGGRGVVNSTPLAPDGSGNLPVINFPRNFRPAHGEHETWTVKLDIDGDGVPESSWPVPDFPVSDNYTGLVGNVFFDAGVIAIEVL